MKSALAQYVCELDEQLGPAVLAQQQQLGQMLVQVHQACTAGSRSDAATCLVRNTV
jgi:hypothetical protein